MNQTVHLFLIPSVSVKSVKASNGNAFGWKSHDAGTFDDRPLSQIKM